MNSLVESIINGDIMFYRFSNFLSQGCCDLLSERFLSSAGLRKRTDGVPGWRVGAYHYQKDVAGYFEDIEREENWINELVRDTPLDPEQFVAKLSTLSGITSQKVRPACWQSKQAKIWRALSWTGDGEFALGPHEDFAQVQFHRQDGFEVFQILESQVSIAVYIRVQGQGGALRIWDWSPDTADRDRLGLTHTGYPYPEEVLKGREYEDVEVTTGDLVLFRGANIHAVLPQFGIDASRILLLSFLGKLPKTGEFVYWT